jgi:hypothetical protein
MKVLGPGEILPDEQRANNPTIALYEASVCLMPKKRLTQARDYARINQTCKHGQENHHPESGSYLLYHSRFLSKKARGSSGEV